MARKPPKTAVVAFKVENELAELLNKLPNKSAFIRKAIAAQLGVACPLCNGKGVVPRGVHDHYAPLLKEFSSRSCDSCGHQLNLPLDSGERRADPRSRLEQFSRGGPLSGDGCYEKAPSCDAGGWHTRAARVAEHPRQAHREYPPPELAGEGLWIQRPPPALKSCAAG